MDEIIQRLNENMLLYGFSPMTQEAYYYRVKKLIEYFNKPIYTVTNEELREYFLFLQKSKKYLYAAIAIALYRIKFLYENIK